MIREHTGTGIGAIDAYEDAVATVRYWQNRGVTLLIIAAQLRCGQSWQAVIERIVMLLLAEEAIEDRKIHAPPSVKHGPLPEPRVPFHMFA